MYKALYRAYRPETFEQLLGQEHIVKILKNQLAADAVSHAYLFCGTRGTGKTTTARLLAKGLNCSADGVRPCGECSSCKAISEGSYMDVIEIDAASNRGIDEIRELRDSVNYPPMLGSTKIYIIDEVHMLTTEAFNALLKTLEEPPEYVVFILATTEPGRLPATILSRCMRLDFRRVPERVIAGGMRKICEDMDIEVTDSALRVIAANADGSVRDGLSILDQCITGAEGQVDSEDVLSYLGASGEEVLLELTDMVIRGRTAEAIAKLADVLEDGKDARQLIRDWIQHYRNLLMTRFIRDPQEVINLSVENIDRIREQSQMMEPDEITRGIMELSKTMNDARWSPKPRILLELCVVTLSSGSGNLQAPVAVARPAAKATKVGSGKPQTQNAAARPAAEVEPVEPAAETVQTQDNAAGPVAEVEPVEPAADTMQIQDAVAEPVAEVAAPEMTQDATSSDELLQLWDQVFVDGSDRIGSMYLIRSNSMLTAMDDNTFTVTVSGDVNGKHIEKNRKLIEEIMANRTGKQRHMNMEMKASDEDDISIEEAAASASELIGVPVEIE